MFLVVVVCRREESTTQSLKIELLFGLLDQSKRREKKREQMEFRQKKAALSMGLSLSSTKKGQKKDMVSSVYLKGPLTKRKKKNLSLFLSLFGVVFK